MPVLSLQAIETLCQESLLAVGASEEQAAIVAAEIAEAEAEGIRNVGLGYIHLYLKHLKVGSTVKLNSTDLDKEFYGTVSRINSIINPTTQMVSIFLKVSGAELREGLYLKAVINGGVEQNALIVDRNMIEDGKAIYTINADSTLVLTPIEVISFSDEKAIIKGITNGMLIPNKAISGAFEGLKVEPSVQ